MTDLNKIENALSGIISDAINGMTIEQVKSLICPWYEV